MDKDKLDANLQRNLSARKKQMEASVTKLYSRKSLEQGFLEVFELVGGVPRLAIWANDPENYGEFLKLLMKFAPKEAAEQTGKVINFVSSVPDSPLNYPRPDHLVIEGEK